MPMHQRNASDRKLIVLLAFLLMLVVAIGLIWRHYDNELQRIEKLRNELKP